MTSQSTAWPETAVLRSGAAPRRQLVRGLLQRHMFAALLVLRLINVFLVQTYIHPDETWQSLEVAHRAVFGYGYVTWEWRHALRGFAHPMLFAAVYSALRAVRLDDTFLVLAAPYMLMAIIAAAADYATFRFARRVAGIQVAGWAVLCSAASLSMGSGVVRPLANSAETALTAIAFVYWPWGRLHSSASVTTATHSSLAIALVFAAISCIIRPTSGALWLCAGIVLLLKQPRAHCAARTLLIGKCVLLVGLPAIASMLLVDRLGYQRWVFPPYQFYLFNVHEGQASWFGKSPPLYHLYVSLPLLFTSMLPFVCHGVYVAYSRGCVTVEPALVSLAAMFVFSLVDHMEYRFLYPLLPVGFLYAAVSINSLAGALPCIGDLRRVASGNNPGSTEEDTNGAEPTVSERAKPLLKAGRLWSARKIILYLLITNVPPTLYLNLVHQRGSVDVMEYLRSEAQSRRIDDVGFLMPCHSTPFYSHLHQPIPMWFLSCEPPLERALLSTHYWEANEFELNPIGFLHKIFQPATGQPAGGVVSSANDIRAVNRIYQPGQARPKPSHLVLYGCMAARIHLELAALGYRECARFFNTHFSIDSRRRGDVVVYRRSMAATSS